MDECIFCKIVAGQMPAIKVYEDDRVLAFLDINPRNPGHTLVIPKKHAETILDLSEKDSGELFERVRKIASSAKESMKADGISIIQNNYRAAGQVVGHVYFHVIPRFESEGPASPESVLLVKKMPEEVLNKIAETIKANTSRSPVQPKETRPEGEARPKKKPSDEFDF